MPNLLGLIHQAEQLQNEVELFNDELKDITDEISNKLETYLVLVNTVIPAKVDMINESIKELSDYTNKLEKWSMFIKGQLHEYFSRDNVSNKVDFGYGEKFIYPEIRVRRTVIPENIPVNRRLYKMSIDNLTDKEYSDLENHISGMNKVYSLKINNSVKDIEDIPEAIDKETTKTIKILKNERK